MFFATIADMINVFEKNDESTYHVKYIKSRLYKTPLIKEYYSLNNIPEAGYSSGDSQGLDNYYIVDKDAVPYPDEKELAGGETAYSIDPWNVDKRNDSAVLKLSLGGISKSGDCFIHAELSACSDNLATNELFKFYQSLIRKSYIKAHSGWWLGTEAIDKYYNKFRFVTIGVGEPKSCDFRFNV